jgi:peptidoglycan-associated lipoprotein
MPKSRWFIALGAAAMLMLAGCSQKTPEPAAPGTDNAGSQYGTEVPGGISSTGKYTGQDGVSASGIKMVYFSTDRYDVEGDQLQRIMSDMPKIKKLASSGKIRVEGNCDEFGTDEYNHALGLKRAKSVKSILVNNGIPASKIDVISYGESNPVCTGTSAPCHAKNRRVEINRAQ